MRRPAAAVFVVLSFCCCSREQRGGTAQPVTAATVTAPTTPTSAVIRATGTIQALKSVQVRVPQIAAQQSRLTLVRLAPNGARVKEGDRIVEFDRTAILDEAREAQAKLDDTRHQMEERKAKALSDSAKRIALVREAEADLAKAEIQIRKGPVIADIDRRKNEVKAVSAKARVDSLKKSHELHEVEEAAAVKVFERKLERQKYALERIRRNLERLAIPAPQDGMIALENTWRSGSMGPSQEGDQVWPGQPVLRIFDPSSMIVDVMINEPDIAALAGSMRAKVYLDAYPDSVFEAVLESASPVATAGLDSPVRTFSARFRIVQQDPRLLPDLSAALEIELDKAGSRVSKLDTHAGAAP
ncbi:MAG: efflux RND transporter periplasmic adaptor subunit [Bryobacteraceae bacterium]